jgi:hypothetical protein
MAKTINIVDADTLAVAAAAQAQEVSIIAKHIPSGKTKRFENVTALKKAMKEKGTFDKFNEIEIEQVVEPAPVEHALSNVKKKLEKIAEVVNADKTVILVGGKSTYRQSLPLPSPYKNKRAPKPIHMEACKEYMVNYKGAYFVNGIEADDEACILSEEYKHKGWKVILSSPDHDSFQMYGITLLNYKEADLIKGFIELGDHSFNVIKKNTYKKSVGSGIGYLAGQMLYGDPTDTYNPTEIANIKYGMISAYKDLTGCVEPKDFLEVVKLKYQEWYPEPITYISWDGVEHTKDWKSILQMYFQCAYMLRSRDDKASAEKFFAEYGVEL